MLNAVQGKQQYLPYALVALPVCLVFGFHQNVPSLVEYCDRNASQVLKAIFIGTGIALVIYILWQLAIQGIYQELNLYQSLKRAVIFQHY